MKQALVFADRSGTELSPLNEHYCPAMLPVSGRPVLEHTLTHLQQAGVEQIFLVVPNGDISIRNYFENGARWSLDIRYLNARESDSTDRVRVRLGNSLAAPFIAIRGDVWRSELRSVSEAAAPYCKVSDQQGNLFELWHNDQNSLDALDWSPKSNQAHTHRQNIVDFDPLCHLNNYHQLVTSMVLDKASMHSTLAPLALSLGAQTRVHPMSVNDGTTTVGDFSCIEIGAQLSGTNYVGRHCFIARGAALKNTVILDKTYVGAGMSLENAIVVQQRVVRVDLNASLDIKDSFILASNRQPWLKKWSYLTAERVVAFALLLAAGVVNALSLRIYNHSLTSRPSRNALYAAVTGKIRLFGRQPCTEDMSGLTASYPWVAQYYKLEPGALSPAKLAYPYTEDPILLTLAEIELSKKDSWKALMINSLRAMRAMVQAEQHAEQALGA
ncbi:sugar phosphate nucleotidyltransferase [Marinobacter sp. AL4B]|uniref:sugar phosphate nucleotidyltransferase n=1 Tax=Marinobacter sp. AL4B TaxID=2871173 RepID=UPI001CAA79A4|nr:NDP-sugar synthase [Marinobacter sp. AL4B]MBZ0333426.1 NDP-sugar synthase [Marinobacter sp. AL4B]